MYAYHPAGRMFTPIRGILLICLAVSCALYYANPVTAKANAKMPSASAKSASEASILMYHRIDDSNGCEFKSNSKVNPYPFEVPAPCVSPDRFEKQIRAMIASGCEFITMTELTERWKTGKASSRKTVVITFDDGYGDNYRNAYPILKSLGIRATIFAVTGKIDTTNAYLTKKQIKKLQNKETISPEWNPYIPLELIDQLANMGQVVKRQVNSRFLSWKEVIELHEAGWDIQSHTVNHDRLTESFRLESELTESKKLLEEKLGKKISILSYPYGAQNTKVMNAAKAAGYAYAVLATKASFASASNPPLKLNRITMLESSGDPTGKTVPAGSKKTGSSPAVKEKASTGRKP